MEDDEKIMRIMMENNEKNQTENSTDGEEENGLFSGIFDGMARMFSGDDNQTETTTTIPEKDEHEEGYLDNFDTISKSVVSVVMNGLVSTLGY